MLIDIIDNTIFMVIFFVLLIILIFKPCYKALRFSNSLKIVCIYISVMTLSIAQNLADDILTYTKDETVRYSVVSSTTSLRI